MEPKEKKPRTPKPIHFEKHIGGNGWEYVGGATSVHFAEKWLKENGEAGVTYRIITVEREVTMKVESRRVASFEYGKPCQSK